MTKTKNISLYSSIVIHIIALLLFYFVEFSVEVPPRQYVLLSFGSSGDISSDGTTSNSEEEVEEESSAGSDDLNDTENSVEEITDIEPPEAVNTDEENVVVPEAEDENRESPSNSDSDFRENEESDKDIKRGSDNSGGGNSPFDILSWGGQGQRRILSHSIPDYPPGVRKEIDLRLRFTILPDGTVGQVTPLIKADTRLEEVAKNALRTWRFEKLKSSQQQAVQTAIIVFRFRLN